MIKKTKTGLFYRREDNLGLLIYSPHTGVFFACKEKSNKLNELISWLNGKKDDAPSIEYANAVGAGWFVELKNAVFPNEHLLSSTNETFIYHTLKPIVANWLITSQCPLNCVYCYAKDVMGCKDKIPANKIIAIAKNILAYHPLAVTLTGGEPLCSPHLELAIKSLYGKTGIILDTSGYLINKEHIKLFKKYDIFVRISLNTELPNKNKKLRPTQSGESSIEQAINSINMCLDSEVPIGIQTIITKDNISDFERLGHKLYRLGIRNWRLMMLANFKGFDEYNTLLGDNTSNRFYKTIRHKLKTQSRNGWNKSMAVQVLHNKEPNAVFLVSPQGQFITEQKNAGKKLLDKANPFAPRLKSIPNNVNMFAHVERYLNL